MQARGCAWVWIYVAVSAAAPASASEPPRREDASQSLYGVSVLVTQVQGSESVSAEHGERVVDAVGRALESHGYTVDVSHAVLRQAVVACQSPECIEQTLDAADAELAIVPAVWSKESASEELTLTLLQRVGRNLNASGPVGADLSAAAEALVNELLAKRAAQLPVLASAPPRKGNASHRPRGSLSDGPKHRHAWKAGPIILLTGGAAAFVAVGVGAATKGAGEQLNTAAVAGWSAVGAAALAGGIAWWVVGAKRRRPAPTITLHPGGVDLSLRF